MHLWRLWIALTLFAAAAAGAAVIYKWTDVDGVVHYSDQPVTGAEKIVISSVAVNGFDAPAAPAPPAAAPRKAAGGESRYSEISIESPANEQVFFADDVVPVRLHLAPPLQADHVVTWQLNGKRLDDQPPDAVGLSLQGLARGIYSITATVTDPRTGESQTSAPVTFNFRQPSELAPLHQKH